MDYSLVKSYDEQSAERFIREVKEEVYTTNGFEILEENGEFAQKGWSLSCNASHKNSPPNFSGEPFIGNGKRGQVFWKWWQEQRG